ncbi:amino acid/polyamine transporter I [Gymnopilus junonius]|uniref:Amino acid/polyamine transporter I n=1 Tax=Gymnopilus junonius TaxID=109634 RepID=A0A9P5NX21_GYMJU|nr:amino acid/polyamine transporter I [Gymnopilus junonius]
MSLSPETLPEDSNHHALHHSEIEPLISTPGDQGTGNYGTATTVVTDAAALKHEQPKRQIGVVSAVFIIFNRLIGTGIFANQSTVLAFSGSVGLSLVMWLVGAIIAAAGTEVYIIWGTALPFNGGEKNYLERLFPKPKGLITSLYAANAVLLAASANGCLVFAEYGLASLPFSLPATTTLSPIKLIAFVCLAGVVLLHGLHVSAGLRLQNFLGVLKLGILFILVATGIAAISGHLQEGIQRPRNFDSWDAIWGGSRTGGSVLCICLYNVLWSYVGFSNANYALSEMDNPARTLRIAAPLALVTVTIFYLLCNIAYFSAVSKEDITGSGRLVAALLFRNVWGESTEKILNAFVALSALGNVLSVSFAQGRVNQALGEEGVLPFSKVWASNWPAKAPLAGLILHWLICILVIFAVPPGDAYNFVLNFTSYPMALVNGVISFGLLYLAFYKGLSVNSSDGNQENPREKTAFVPSFSLIASVLVFGGANIFLSVVPLLKPPPGAEPYEELPYWTHAVGGLSIFFIGWLWWLWHYRRS